MSKERKKYELRPIVMSVTVVLFALMLIAIVWMPRVSTTC